MTRDPASPPASPVPAWLSAVGRLAARDRAPELERYTAPGPSGARTSAVLVLFGTGDPGPGGPDGPDIGPELLLLRRSDTLRDHPGQVCFPGGSVEAGDRDAVHTALRETHEETGLPPTAVRVLTALPPLYLASSGFSVTLVLGWWDGSGEPAGRDGEIVSVHRVPLRELADPGNRLGVRFPTGYVGPGFLARGLFVWGFTGSVVAWLLRLAGWERPWDTGRVVELAEARRRYDGGLPV